MNMRFNEIPFPGIAHYYICWGSIIDDDGKAIASANCLAFTKASAKEFCIDCLKDEVCKQIKVRQDLFDFAFSPWSFKSNE